MPTIWTGLPATNGIGTLREQSLHAELKTWLAQPGDLTEQVIDGFHIDLLRPGLLIEIQTGKFTALKRKLPLLLQHHNVQLAYPIPQHKWIVRIDRRGRQISRRKSPKLGRLEHVFDELVSIPRMALHPNFQLLALLTDQEEIWIDDGRGSWRRGKWSIGDRRLLSVAGTQKLTSLVDFLAFLPDALPEPFSNRQLAKISQLNIHLCRKITYCLRQMGGLYLAGKEGNAHLFGRSQLS